MNQIKRALLSVSDKSDLLDFASALTARDVELLSTGGTARALREGGLAVTEVSDYTGFPEIMEGRVKTLHPKVHGALLGRRGIDENVMAEHGITPIDLLVVNLYPFRTTVARSDCSFQEAVENIDIGGPAMLRAAAKNLESVSVVVDPADYRRILGCLDECSGAVPRELRLELAAKAFAHTAEYDRAIHQYLASKSDGARTDRFEITLDKRASLRYGENPHQKAAFYVESKVAEACVANAAIHQGKPLSFNNIADADAALECVRQFYEPACVIVKHANPCGVAVDKDIGAAYERAFSTDTTSAFGGIIAFNRSLDATTAQLILDKQFVEVIIAPEIEPDALKACEHKQNVRILTTGWWDMEPAPGLDYKKVSGGLLVQDKDIALARSEDLEVVTEKTPSEHEIRDLLFAWKVVKFVKSNAIVFCKDQMTIGIGAGQMSRVYSVRLAAMKAVDAGLAVKGSVMASDAFFPFRDSVDDAARHEATAIIQPGGSKRDDEVIAAANEHGLAMVFTRMRHFRH